jgi:hypothetical protein
MCCVRFCSISWGIHQAESYHITNPCAVSFFTKSAHVLRQTELNPLNKLKFILFGRGRFSTLFKTGQMHRMRDNKKNNLMNSLTFTNSFIKKEVIATEQFDF